jgi:methyl-galactoside transport system ATP-binding protein
MSEVLLQMKEICKSFPGVKALDKVSFSVKAGSVHALMGENGAGKSTLMKCLFGLYQMDSGQVFLDGKEVYFHSPKEAILGGASMVQQELNQVSTRSVMENIWLGRFPTFAPGLVNHQKMKDDTKKIFEELQINLDPTTKISSLSVSKRQMVEIAKAVSYHSKIIVFDEPTSSLTDVEVNKLFDIIRDLKKRGCGIIYISHKMAEIYEIADEITVMRDGKKVITSRVDQIGMNQLISSMVGRELTQVYPPKTNEIKEMILEVNHLTTTYTGLEDISFQARKGEIIGIAGLVGSGRTELLEALYGLSKVKSGEIRFHEKKLSQLSPRAAKKLGFAFLTEERRQNGIFSILSVRENTTIAKGRQYEKYHLFLSKREMISDTDWSIRSLRIKTSNQNTRIGLLSGGNQQKVILGRWLLTKPEVLLLDEPTRGIDVGAKFEIYQLMIQLASSGKTILMTSSEMPELLGICDRIIVLSEGRCTGIVDVKTTSQEEIMRLASITKKKKREA